MNRSDLMTKSQSRVNLNIFLLSVSITAFFLIVNLRQEFLNNKLLLLQLVLAIPLFLTSIIANSKIAYKEKPVRWNRLGWLTFVVGYAFIINIIGIVIGNLISVTISLIFFGASWFLTVTKSLVDLSNDKTILKERIIKDSLFIALQLTCGVFVVLKIIK